jgi:hypothetical protein
MTKKRIHPSIPHQPGPVYDAVTRAVMESDPAAACRLLGIPITTPNGAPEVLPAKFPVISTRESDLVLRIGPNELAHVEYVRRVDDDLVPRMLDYRARIMLAHKDDTLRQYVLVLGEGTVRGHDEPAAKHFWLGLAVVYARDLDPEWCLSEPSLAPLAPLGRGSPAERAQHYKNALRTIQKHDGPNSGALLTCTSVLATITLDLSIIEQIAEEVEMTVADIMLQLPWGREVLQVGLETGREEGREETLTLLLEQRFGRDHDVRPIARHLATWTDHGAALHAILTVDHLDDLAAEPSRS